MKIKLLFLLIFCPVALLQAQDVFQINGVVSSQNFLLKGVEIINRNSQQIVMTDDFGNFSIAAKNNDQIVFFSNKYEVYSITINKPEHFEKKVSIKLTKKPIQIDEVIVEQNSKWSSDYLSKIMDKQYIDDGQTSPANTIVYDGQTLGMDFIALGRLVKRLFKDKDKHKESAPPPIFYDYVTANFNTSFFMETLKLPEDEISLFLEFCMADPKSDTLSKSNYLETMDFLMAKNKEFTKVKAVLNSQGSKP